VIWRNRFPEGAEAESQVMSAIASDSGVWIRVATNILNRVYPNIFAKYEKTEG
jgi:hypothetical protein